jgi:hypothetical protein
VCIPAAIGELVRERHGDVAFAAACRRLDRNKGLSVAELAFRFGDGLDLFRPWLLAGWEK